MADLSSARETQEARRRWLLLTPALIILVIAATGPLLITVVYSFLTPGDYGGIIWSFSGLLRCASVDLLAIGEAVFDDDNCGLRDRVSNGVFHRNTAQIAARFLDAADHYPVLDQPFDPHLCDYGTDPQ